MKPDSVFYPQAVDCLQRSPVFSGLSGEILENIIGRCRFETWKRHRQMPLEESWRRFHILLSGRVRLNRSNPNTGRVLTLFLLGPGEPFCLFSLLDGQPHEVTLEAVDDVSLLSVPMGEARQWLEDYPAFNRKLLPYLGTKMANLADLAADIALHDTETRLARLILSHVDTQGVASTKPKLINDLSHETLADMIGSVRVVVNRQIQHWKQEGIIDAHRGHLAVESLQKLARKAEQLLSKSKNKV